MQAQLFSLILQQQMDQCLSTLDSKAKEYADDVDRLRNFKQAAHLQGISYREALAGMMAKHTVSIYDMCKSPDMYPMAVWEEKLGDHLNYLFLLKAVIHEEWEEQQLADFPYLPLHNA